MKKLTCHCENVELEVNIPEGGFPKLMRCNCSLCKRKGAVMSPLPKENVKLVKGQDSLKLYQYHTKVAEHYFCSNCGIYTHHKMRSNPNMIGVNVACIEGINPFELGDIAVNDGINHPLDQKK
tara:strand:+ start:673 stop:1041 length:369 start_codon:yes stop_codon:yes gene_type:complete